MASPATHRAYMRCKTLERENKRLRTALEESIKLQSHYALLLNEYDNGKRLIFLDAKDWIDRLNELGKLEE